MTFEALKLARTQRKSKLSEQWNEAGIEPRLSDVLSDPLVHQVMQRDGLRQADLEAAVAFGQRQLRRRLCPLCAA